MKITNKITKSCVRQLNQVGAHVQTTIRRGNASSEIILTPLEEYRPEKHYMVLFSSSFRVTHSSFDDILSSQTHLNLYNLNTNIVNGRRRTLSPSTFSYDITARRLDREQHSPSSHNGQYSVEFSCTVVQTKSDSFPHQVAYEMLHI